MNIIFGCCGVAVKIGVTQQSVIKLLLLKMYVSEYSLCNAINYICKRYTAASRNA